MTTLTILTHDFPAARQELADIRDRFGLDLPDEAAPSLPDDDQVAATNRQLDQGVAMAAAAGLNDFGREMADARVKLKRRWGRENPSPGPGRPRAGNGLSDNPFTTMQRKRMRQLADIPLETITKVFEDSEETGEVPSETSILVMAGKVKPPANLRRGAKEGGGVVEWYTPPELIEKARSAMGAIDLDPASNPKAQEWIQAERYFTAADDGLAQEWNGRVWLNPPYKTAVIKAFAAKAVSELDAGRVEQLCWISPPNSTDAAWCQELLTASSALCLLAKRVRFIASDGHAEGSAWPHMVVYLGGRPECFEEAFASEGVVWRRGA